MMWKCEICGKYENAWPIALGGVLFVVICTDHLREFETFIEHHEEAMKLNGVVQFTEWFKLHGTDDEYDYALKNKLEAHLAKKLIVEKWFGLKLAEKYVEDLKDEENDRS